MEFFIAILLTLQLWKNFENLLSFDRVKADYNGNSLRALLF